MSAYIAFMSNLVDIGTTPEQWKNQFKAIMVANGWQTDGETDLGNGKYEVHFIPPAYEEIGNDNGYEVVRIEFNPTYMRFGCAMKTRKNIESVVKFIWTGFTAGTASVTVGTTTISQDAVNGNTINQNLDLLLEKLTTSDSTDILKFDWKIVTNYDTSPDINILEATCKTTEVVSISATGPNCTYYGTKASNIGDPLLPTLKFLGNLPIDLSAGFIYFFTIRSRSITFGTKTVAGYYGPHASHYISHEDALINTPIGCTPIELATLDLSTANVACASVWTHAFGYMRVGPNYPDNINRIGYYNDPLNYHPIDIWGCVNDPMRHKHSLCDVQSNVPMLNNGWSPWNFNPQFFPLGSDSSTVSNRQSAISSIAMNAISATLDNYSQNSLVAFFPSMNLTDLYSYNTPSATNESLILSRSCKWKTYLSADIDNGVLSSISLQDGTNFPSGGGSLIIGREIFQYAGKSDANTLTGITRAMFGTPDESYKAGSDVSLGLYFVKVNACAVYAGTVRPQ